MKKMKKLAALLMAMVMVMGLGVTAHATKVEDGELKSTITIKNLSEGVETTLNLYTIMYLDRDGNGNEKWTEVEWADPYIEADETTGAYKITDAEGLKAAAEKTAADKQEKATETSYTFRDLPIGAYVILASDSAGTYGLMAANTYDEDAKYMKAKPAEVTAKMEGYNVGKTADDQFVDRGQEVTFTITTKFPVKRNAQGDELNCFKIKDTPSGLLIRDDLPTVTIGGEEKTIDETMITHTKTDDDTQTAEYIVDLTSFIEGEEPGSAVTVTYKAIVIDDAKYNNNAGVEANTVQYNPTRVDGFEGNITLTKINEKSEKLAGAEFQVYEAEEGETKENALDKEPLYFVETVAGDYKQALTANEAGATQTIVTGKEGTVKVTGLDEGTYYFKETKAPEGYALVEDPAGAVIEAGDSDKEVSVGANGEFTFTNTKLSALPSTGGIGTMIFTIAGCAIMITAAGIFFATRKKA